jgi:hypothetical protein
MIVISGMKLFKILILLSISLLSCSTIGITGKLVPEYKGIDPLVRSYYDEYIFLASQNGIKFFKPITIGMKDIEDTKNLWIGMCNYGLGFREIDIDKSYWSHADALSKQALIYHELTHCLCNRYEHDYGDGKLYPEPNSNAPDIKGYYDDGCPLSIMHPTVAPSVCVSEHYEEYIKEMFDRCAAW